jgi:uncharacterized protein YigE (DUF2233 family)
MVKSSGKVAVDKVNNRLNNNDETPAFEAYKFSVLDAKNQSCVLCNKQVNGKAYSVFIRLKEAQKVCCCL